jgi:hypothetical protein
MAIHPPLVQMLILFLHQYCMPTVAAAAAAGKAAPS